jgi:hypothetical protein
VRFCYHLAFAFALCAAGGCTAEVGGEQQPGGDGTGAGAGAAAGAGAGGAASTSSGGLTWRRLRRLSVREYANVVSDLLGPDAAAEVVTALPLEPRLGGFDNQDSALFVSAAFQESVADLAEKLAKAAEPATLWECDTLAGSTSCVEDFLVSFATRAYGRRPAEDELTRLRTVAATGEDYATSLRLIVEVVLQSPHTLYASELGPRDAAATPGQPLRLTPDELASQLSFLLRGSRPDEELRAAAASTKFADPQDIEREATRLLAASSSLRELRRFVFGWLDMEEIAEAPKSAEAFPELTEAVVSAMQQELDAFLDARLEGAGTVADFFTATPSSVSQELRAIYGADYEPAGGFDPARRAGVLSLPGFLTYHASQQHSGPVERGLFVRRQLLCTVIPPPPAAVLERLANNPLDDVDRTKTTRQKYEVHLDDSSCSGCHRQFDPIGFGMEEMDGIGRYRTTENGLPVDSTGELSGTDVDGPFEGVAQLSSKLAQSKMLEACVVNHFFRFATARSAEPDDTRVLADWSAAFSQAGGKLEALISAYVAHPTFALRRDDR